jgi:DNA-directed RNA polymerase subunit RPC12/RpoP
VAACSTQNHRLQHYKELRPSCQRCAYRLVKMEESASVRRLACNFAQSASSSKKRLTSVSEHNEPLI